MAELISACVPCIVNDSDRTRWTYLSSQGRRQEIPIMLKFSLGTSLVLATVAATLVASPSFAATRHVRAVQSYTAAQSYAAAPGYGYASAPVVIVDGQVVGADPDPNIRLQLMKDAATPNE
jgi:hypothetical protein